MKKKLSIIIPVYNVEKYVERCLRSCVEQDISTQDYEVIVINDGATDGSLAVVEVVAKEYTNIFVYSQENAGLSAARNKGLLIATGEYVWFIDSDDFINRNCLKFVLDKCESQRLEVLGIGAANIMDQVIVRRFSIPSDYKFKILSGRDLLLNGLWQTCAPFSIYKRNFLLSNNLFFYEGIYHEDSEFTPRAYYLAEKIMLEDDLLYLVNQNPNSITRTANSKKSFDILKVCVSLDLFLLNVEMKYHTVFSNLISCNLNTSLNGICTFDRGLYNRLNLEIDKNRFLFKHLLKSNILKYKLEGILFNIFRGKYIQVYKYLQKFNKN